jgi:hypothetical protein
MIGVVPARLAFQFEKGKSILLYSSSFITSLAQQGQLLFHDAEFG